eukprot:6291712-Alexandrium_andersonii.AAC.1
MELLVGVGASASGRGLSPSLPPAGHFWICGVAGGMLSVSDLHRLGFAEADANAAKSIAVLWGMMWVSQDEERADAYEIGSSSDLIGHAAAGLWDSASLG